MVRVNIQSLLNVESLESGETGVIPGQAGGGGLSKRKHENDWEDGFEDNWEDSDF